MQTDIIGVGREQENAETAAARAGKVESEELAISFPGH